MNGSRSQRALLVEIMIAVLFFALCATVLVQTFAAARALSHRAGAEGAALIEAQDLAEQLRAADDAEALLSSLGFARAEDAWRRAEGDCTMEVVPRAEAFAAGRLFAATVRVTRAEETVVELPVARYIPEEAGA